MGKPAKQKARPTKRKERPDNRNARRDVRRQFALERINEAIDSHSLPTQVVIAQEIEREFKVALRTGHSDVEWAWGAVYRARRSDVQRIFDSICASLGEYIAGWKRIHDRCWEKDDMSGAGVAWKEIGKARELFAPEAPAPTVNVTVNVATMTPLQRQQRIEELRGRLPVPALITGAPVDVADD